MRNQLMVVGIVAAAVVGCEKSEGPTVARYAPATPSIPSTKLTKENYLKIQPGMDSSDIELILGKPTKFTHDGYTKSTYFYQDGSRTITIHTKSESRVSFVGKVTHKTCSGLD